MAITATTLSAACGASDLSISVASATGITAPNYTSGSGIVILQVDMEYMAVLGVSGTVVSVQRGMYGSPAVSHVANSRVGIGLPSDFPPVVEVVASSQTITETVGSYNMPAVVLSGSADAIPSTVPGFYVVKTAGVNSMTLAAPTAAQEGNVIDVWSDTTNAHTITATSLLANGTALKTTATFAAFRGAGMRLRACNLVWHVMSNTAVVLT
jgi:hypothetical protein